jgi:hypothetical protein
MTPPPKPPPPPTGLLFTAAKDHVVGSILGAHPSLYTQTSANSPNPNIAPQIPQISLTDSIADVSPFIPISLDLASHNYSGATCFIFTLVVLVFSITSIRPLLCSLAIHGG